jgi:HD-GYP domain-containing protein (c-di-GMP phosphodiesterase class II)
MNIAHSDGLLMQKGNRCRLYVDELRIGMFVCELDRPWLETPFLLQGFVIQDNEDLDKLREFCEYVYVDMKSSGHTAASVPPPVRREAIQNPSDRGRRLCPGKKIEVYTDVHGFTAEFEKAREAVDQLSLCVDDIFSRTAKGGALDGARIRAAVEPMIDSVTRNPDACIWLARMKQVDDYIYEHSLSASIWAVALGRQLGLPRVDLRSLAVGGVLLDIGKLKVPEELLNAKRRLSDAEFAQIKRHVQFSLDMTKNDDLMNQDVIDMVAYHHERYDGSGYPYGLAGDDIPIYARIAAIVDSYDAMTSSRSYARALTPAQAIKALYEQKDVQFQGELVEAFIQSIGIYPAGTLVELSTGEVAVVIAEYRARRLRPQVMVVLDADKKPLDNICMIDLSETTHTLEGEPLEIVDSLSPDDYGIDLGAIVL